MIPISDSVKTQKTPIVTYILLFINVFVFAFMFLMTPSELDLFILKYSLIPSEIVRGEDLYALLTSMFLHGGVGHIFSNMIFLHVFGDNLEEAYGSFGYLVFYIVSGIGASALQIFVNPGSTIPNLGASGAIAGLLGGYLVFFPNHRVDVLIPLGYSLRRTTVPAQMMLLYWIGFQFLHGVGTLGIDGGGVAYFAHIGGFVAGVIISLAVRPIIKRNSSF